MTPAKTVHLRLAEAMCPPAGPNCLDAQVAPERHMGDSDLPAPDPDDLRTGRSADAECRISGLKKG